MKYFEIEFTDGKSPDVCICIRGTREPTIEEAVEFCKEDAKFFGMPVSNVYPIDEESARRFYDFDNEINWQYLENKVEAPISNAGLEQD